MTIAGAIDLGTNTARLLIGKISAKGEIQPLLVERAIIRLGGGFCRTKGIAPDACRRAQNTLAAFTRILQQHRVTAVRAVATSAVRDAANGEAFCAEIARTTGLRLEIIDGTEEGVLTLNGVRAGIRSKCPQLLVFDVGGGSTEYTLARNEAPLYTESLPLGVVRLTEGKVTEEAMIEKIGRELAGLQGRIEKSGFMVDPAVTELVATAGTATTLAAIYLGLQDYDYRKVNNHILTREEIIGIFARLQPLTPAQRLQVVGLEPGREDLIIAGILLTLKTMDLFGFNRLKVSDFGLLEGVLLSIVSSADS